MTDSIITTGATIWRDEAGIVHVQASGVPSTKETVEESFAAMRELLHGDQARFLFDARKWPSGDPGSWVSFIKRIQEVCIAGAILIDPEHPAALGPYPDLLSRLLVPLGVFESEDEALEFLALHVD